MILPFLTNRLYKVHRWYGVTSSDPITKGEEIEETEDLGHADIVTSIEKRPHYPLTTDGEEMSLDFDNPEYWHTPVLDIDVPAALVPSSTPGKHHLYLDVPMTWETYVKLLDVMAEAGILEPGYVGASKARGFTAVRLPWIRKNRD